MHKILLLYKKKQDLDKSCFFMCGGVLGKIWGMMANYHCEVPDTGNETISWSKTVPRRHHSQCEFAIHLGTIKRTSMY